MKTIDELQLRDREKQSIRKATRLLKEIFFVKEVILFGSKARGTDDPESDIDLLLLTSKPLHWKERESIINTLFDIEMEFDVVISILDTTVAEWNNGIFTKFPIHATICHDGAISL